MSLVEVLADMAVIVGSGGCFICGGWYVLFVVWLIMWYDSVFVSPMCLCCDRCRRIEMRILNKSRYHIQLGLHDDMCTSNLHENHSDKTKTEDPIYPAAFVLEVLEVFI